MDIRKDVQAVIDGILTGKILDTFDKYYADNVVMSENGADERAGKATNRQYEEAFLANTEFHSTKVGATVVDGNNAAVEWTLATHRGDLLQRRWSGAVRLQLAGL